MTNRSLLAAVAALSLLLASPSARAQTRLAHCDANADKPCTYVFIDDPLDAHAFGANDVLLRVAPHAFRTTLVRPRASFVTEMLESVEKM